MNEMQEIKVFDNQTIRTYWDDDREMWYFSVNDIVLALTDSVDVKQYIKRLRQREPELNSVWGTICTPHQFISTDGKRHSTNCTNIAGVLRIVMSIPSTKAEPLKRWLAEEGSGYATLTDIIYQAWSGLTAREYKHFKGLHQENLRDNMTNEELVMNMLAELTTTNITKAEHPLTMPEHVRVAERGGSVARVAREAFEQQTGKTVVSDMNMKRYLDSQQSQLPFEEAQINEE